MTSAEQQAYLLARGWRKSERGLDHIYSTSQELKDAYASWFDPNMAATQRPVNQAEAFRRQRLRDAKGEQLALPIHVERKGRPTN